MKNNAEKFANEGLRTLVFAKKTIDDNTYSKWIEKFNVKHKFATFNH